MRSCEEKLATCIAVTRRRDVLKIKTPTTSSEPETGELGLRATAFAELEGALERRVTQGLQGVASGMAAAIERLASSLSEARAEISREGDARRTLEASVTHAVESAVLCVANATRVEIAKHTDDASRLEAQMRRADALHGDHVQGRCERVEEALICRVAERERGLRLVRTEISQATHVLLDELAQERHARIRAAAVEAANAKRALAVSSLMTDSRRLADNAETLSTIKTSIHELDRANQLRFGQAKSSVDALAAVTSAQLSCLERLDHQRFSRMSARMSATEQAFQEMEDDLLVSTTVEHIVSTVVDAHHAAAIDREAAARATQAAHANLTVHSHFEKIDTALSAGQLVASEDRELASSRYNEQTKTLSSVVEQIAVLTESLQDSAKKCRQRALTTDNTINAVARVLNRSLWV